MKIKAGDLYKVVQQEGVYYYYLNKPSTGFFKKDDIVLCLQNDSFNPHACKQRKRDTQLLQFLYNDQIVLIRQFIVYMCFAKVTE
jgi:hypothetical protein